MKITINRLAPLMLGAILLAGCAKPPAEQIDAAEKALKEAQMSGAATYTAQEYAKLEASLTAMKKEVTDQDGKFALFRDYGKAEQLAASAKADGERVKAARLRAYRARAISIAYLKVDRCCPRQTRSIVRRHPGIDAIEDARR